MTSLKISQQGTIYEDKETIHNNNDNNNGSNSHYNYNNNDFERIEKEHTNNVIRSNSSSIDLERISVYTPTTQQDIISTAGNS